MKPRIRQSCLSLAISIAIFFTAFQSTAAAPFNASNLLTSTRITVPLDLENSNNVPLQLTKSAEYVRLAHGYFILKNKDIYHFWNGSYDRDLGELSSWLKILSPSINELDRGLRVLLMDNRHCHHCKVNGTRETEIAYLPVQQDRKRVRISGNRVNKTATSNFQLHETEAKRVLDAIHQIQLDVNRTKIADGKLALTEAQKISLYRVALILAMKRPLVGYCQGMNSFIAYFLQYGFTDREIYATVQTFFSSDAQVIWNTIGFQSTRNKYWDHVVYLGHIFDTFLHDVDPQLHAHFMKMGIHPDAYTSTFLRDGFIGHLNKFGAKTLILQQVILETILKGNEIAFYEGTSLSVFMGVLIAIFEGDRERLLKMDDFTELWDFIFKGGVWEKYYGNEGELVRDVWTVLTAMR